LLEITGIHTDFSMKIKEELEYRNRFARIVRICRENPWFPERQAGKAQSTRKCQRFACDFFYKWFYEKWTARQWL